VILGPAVAIGGLTAAKLVTLLSVQALAGVTSYVTHRITGSMLGAAATALALLAIPAAVDRGGFVPMYPTMLALGYLGGALAYIAMSRPERSWPAAVGAGVCLAMAPEAQGVGVLFLAVPLLLAVFSPTWQTALASCARIYLVVAVAAIPRLAVNLSVDGLDRLTTFRADYWVTKGYIREIQSNFWHYSGVNEPLGEYVGRLPWRFTHALGPRGYVVLALALVTWIALRRVQARVFVLAVIGAMLLALMVKQVPPFPRYYSPLWPGIAVLAGVGVAGLGRHPARVARVLAIALVPVLTVLAAGSLVSIIHHHDRLRARVDNGPYGQLAAAVDDGKGVIGARSPSLVSVNADRATWGGQFLTEDEFVTFLTWPSDAAVIEVMERHDIGWVLIHPNRAIETTYHDTWLMPHYGRPARHVDQVAASANFCPVVKADGFVLYRLGACDVSP
jgi:4-amino-4-deoxy-L-arabinose transferase-like glycosyltransferase